MFCILHNYHTKIINKTLEIFDSIKSVTIFPNNPLNFTKKILKLNDSQKFKRKILQNFQFTLKTHDKFTALTSDPPTKEKFSSIFFVFCVFFSLDRRCSHSSSYIYGKLLIFLPCFFCDVTPSATFAFFHLLLPRDVFRASLCAIAMKKKEENGEL